MNDTDLATSEPSPAHLPAHLPHGGPPDMVPFESPSRWERTALAVALAATLILGVLAGVGAVRRAGGDEMSSTRLTTGSSSDSR